ncbi:MAG: ankyrin repeat domain-containing protein [Myxococcota bacterium]
MRLLLPLLLAGSPAFAGDPDELAHLGDPVRIQSVLAADPAAATRRDAEGRTALHHAAEGDLAAVEALVEGGADIDARTKAGATPLYLAVRANRYEIARYLLDRGADPDAAGTAGPPLAEAVAQGTPEMVRLLVQRGANPRVTDKTGATPLHAAVATGRIELVRALLDGGAPANATDHAGNTPLHVLAAKSGRAGGLEIARLLVERGARPNARDNEGRTPLGLADTRGAREVAEVLRARGGVE